MKFKNVDNPDVQDQRGRGGGGGGMGGLPFPIPMGRRAGGGGGLVMILVVLFFLFKGSLFGGTGNNGITPIPGLPQAPAPSASDTTPQGDTSLQLVKAVSKDIEDFWAGQFQQSGKPFEHAPVLLFTGGTQTGCGPASSATGPFYCPVDQKVYIDLGFFKQLASQFGAPGDFAQAYVVAHELGHHVQKLLGIEPEVRAKQQANPDQANDLSVRMELQADCLAGVWGHSVYVNTKNGTGNIILEDGDIDEGLRAAAAVGDDRLGARSREQWTHGSSALRVKWFKAGYESGDANSCNTFSGDL